MMSSVELLLSVSFHGRRTQIIACFVNPLKCDITTFTYAMVFSGYDHIRLVHWDVHESAPSSRYQTQHPLDL